MRSHCTVAGGDLQPVWLHPWRAFLLMEEVMCVLRMAPRLEMPLGEEHLPVSPQGLAILLLGLGLGLSMFMASKKVCCHGLSDGTRGTERLIA